MSREDSSRLQIQKFLRKITSKYESISKLEVIGNTYEKRPIYAVHISRTSMASKPIVMLECGTHAREWSSIEVCLYFIYKIRVAKAGAKAVKKYGKTSYEVGNIAHIIYRATGASVDYAYDKGNAKYAYAIELREGKIRKGGFILLEDEIIPLCKETFAGLQASILAMKTSKY
ncbi:mast cell carboxypeptidase A [Trichonephila inaurata madagascariensis]|uniref:Mast cell carboxypeptidase A n=1 Tax=Trichonephila inaurata madagascariensis TaxID=2747483 RepID=A0A8X6X990_9ARAC|nr:mast cell carboxypeptidase A [Trichonephila inaurata madagascariensis]